MGGRKSDLRSSDVADGCKGLSAVTMRQVAEADCVVTRPRHPSSSAWLPNLNWCQDQHPAKAACYHLLQMIIRVSDHESKPGNCVQRSAHIYPQHAHKECNFDLHRHQDPQRATSSACTIYKASFFLNKSRRLLKHRAASCAAGELFLSGCTASHIRLAADARSALLATCNLNQAQSAAYQIMLM